MAEMELMEDPLEGVEEGRWILEVVVVEC